MLSATPIQLDPSAPGDQPQDAVRQAPRRPETGDGWNWLLTAEHQQRKYLLRFGIGAALCLAALTALEIGLYIGVCQHPALIHSMVAVGVLLIVAFYGLMRTGLNKRFADPSLTSLEINATNAFIAVGYWLATPIGQAIPLVMVVVVLMFGMFTTTPKQLGRCCLWAMAMLSMAFVAVAHTEADPLVTLQQRFHAVLMVIALTTVYVLGAQLAKIRAGLRKRKDELQAALQRIETLATIDMLTGLLNRREMHNVLDRQEKMTSRNEQGFCVCMIDIDFFKKINDTHGHNTGDEVLRTFAATAKSALRDTDVISRWGGEEFLVMMMGSDVASAQAVVERVHAAVKDMTVQTAKGETLKMTFSAGLARYRPGEPMDSVIERADRALYRAKSSGRDRTVIDPNSAASADVVGMAL